MTATQGALPNTPVVKAPATPSINPPTVLATTTVGRQSHRRHRPGIVAPFWMIVLRRTTARQGVLRCIRAAKDPATPSTSLPTAPATITALLCRCRRTIMMAAPEVLKAEVGVI
ncbi:hypothetical protein U1Q18_026623 [Sarracenia purpurea var. burkii]